MPSPFIPKNSSVYHYRQRVPKDIAEAAKGQSVTIVVDEGRHKLTVGSELKVSLQTKDPREAKERAKDVQGQFDMFWAKFRNNETELTFKQVVGLAGEVYRRLVSFEDTPGDSSVLWDALRVRVAQIKAMPKYRNPLTIDENWVDPLEDYFGNYVDEVLDRHGLKVGRRTRRLLLDQVVKVYEEAVELMDRRTQGDYRPDDNTLRFPAFEPPASAAKPTPNVPPTVVTFDEVIRLEVEHRKSGVGAKFKPMPQDSINKYAKAAADFAAFRGDGGELITTVTADELEGWIAALLDAGQLTARTIRGKASDIKTIVGWGVKRVKPSGALREISASLETVELPGFTKKPSDITAIRPDEAAQVLSAARREDDPRTRWLPWLSAYTGARINELAPLEREDFVEVEGYWFFKISQTAKRSVKTASSIRYVPLHPALIDEGLLSFVLSIKSGRLFGKDGEGVVQKWFRNPGGANVQREGVAPSHGWRHLFEDICIRDGVSDSAKRYITGRAKGSSDEDYGKTLVRLPGLAREVEKIQPFQLR